MQATARALGIPMKRIQLEAVVANRASQVEQLVQAGGGGGQVEHAAAAPVGQKESVVLTADSQSVHLEVTTGSSSQKASSPQPTSHVSTSQCLTNLFDCTCDQTAPQQENASDQENPNVSQMSNLLDVPDFTDSPPRMKEVQDAVQVILERDLVTLEEDINSLEKVLCEEVTTVNMRQGLSKHLKAEPMSSSQQYQMANPLVETGASENQNSSAHFEDVSENTRRAHSNKRGRDQNEDTGESESDQSLNVGGGPVEHDLLETRLKCEMCGNLSLKSQSALENHVAGHFRADIAKTCSNLMRGLQCTICGLEAKTRNQLVTHIGCKHGRVRCLFLF